MSGRGSPTASTNSSLFPPAAAAAARRRQDPAWDPPFLSRDLRRAGSGPRHQQTTYVESARRFLRRGDPGGHASSLPPAAGPGPLDARSIRASCEPPPFFEGEETSQSPPKHRESDSSHERTRNEPLHESTKPTPDKTLAAVRAMPRRIEDDMKAAASGPAAPGASLKILFSAFLTAPDYEEARAETEDRLRVAIAESGRCNVALNEVHSTGFRGQVAAMAPESALAGKRPDDHPERAIDELNTMLEATRSQIDLISSTRGNDREIWRRMASNERPRLGQIFSRRGRVDRLPAHGADGRTGSASEGGRA